jgi:hypothetical protein
LLVKQQLDRNGYAPKFPGNFQRQFSTVWIRESEFECRISIHISHFLSNKF